MITYETRKEAGQGVNKTLRRKQILDILTEYGPLTAKQISVIMHQKGYTDNEDRNNAAPRLTELLELGLVELAGKTMCMYTGKTVTVFKRRHAVPAHDA